MFGKDRDAGTSIRELKDLPTGSSSVDEAHHHGRWPAPDRHSARTRPMPAKTSSKSGWLGARRKFRNGRAHHAVRIQGIHFSGTMRRARGAGGGSAWTSHGWRADDFRKKRGAFLTKKPSSRGSNRNYSVRISRFSHSDRRSMMVAPLISGICGLGPDQGRSAGARHTAAVRAAINRAGGKGNRSGRRLSA